MEIDTACSGSNSTVKLRTESLPFSRIPGQSRIFVQYQADPLSLKKYYPSAVASHTAIVEQIPCVLANYVVDRTLLCDALEKINRDLGNGARALEHVQLLRDPGSVAIVTGQQAGLFTGPLYTIYKALSAVRAAECLRGRGYKAVPVFWAATEDHDFDEVASTTVIDRDGGLARIENRPAEIVDGSPVGRVTLDGTIDETIKRLFAALAPTEFSDSLRQVIGRSWANGSNFGDSFASLLSHLMRDHGLILCSPLDPRLKELAAPIYSQAINRSAEIVNSLRIRNAELKSAGYEAQVLIEENYFPLFWHDDNGARIALRRSADDSIVTRDGTKRFSIDELETIAVGEPSRFSPGVMLRSVVQDYLLPNVCYIGGGAEIAYFAQNSEVYRVLDRPVTPIVHRQSFTFIESRHERIMERFGFKFEDLFRGLDALRTQVVDENLGRQTAKVFAMAEEGINIELNRLDQELSQIDPTLAENLATRRRKIIYHIEALRNKARRAQLEKDETAHRRLQSLFAALLPNAGLQERSLNVTYFLNRYGPGFIDLIYNSIDLDDRSHRLVYI